MANGPFNMAEVFRQFQATQPGAAPAAISPPVPQGITPAAPPAPQGIAQGAALNPLQGLGDILSGLQLQPVQGGGVNLVNTGRGVSPLDRQKLAAQQRQQELMNLFRLSQEARSRRTEQRQEELQPGRLAAQQAQLAAATRKATEVEDAAVFAKFFGFSPND